VTPVSPPVPPVDDAEVQAGPTAGRFASSDHTPDSPVTAVMASAPPRGRTTRRRGLLVLVVVLVVAALAGGAVAYTQLAKSSPHRVFAQGRGGHSTPATSHASSNPGGGGTVTPTTTPPTSTPAASSLGPSQTVADYWNAVNVGNYQEAWALGGDNLQAADGSASQFGVNNADEVGTSAVNVTGVNGEEVYVDLTTAGATYSGYYVVSNGVITSANIQQTG